MIRRRAQLRKPWCVEVATVDVMQRRLLPKEVGAIRQLDDRWRFRLAPPEQGGAQPRALELDDLYGVASARQIPRAVGGGRQFS